MIARRIVRQVVRAKGGRSAGQSLVEFALCLPLLALLTFGALDFGRALYAYVSLSGAAKATAEFWARNDHASLDEARQVALQEAGPFFAGAPTSGPGALSVSPSVENKSKIRLAKVTLSYAFAPITPALFGQTIPLEVSAASPVDAT